MPHIKQTVAHASEDGIVTSKEVKFEISQDGLFSFTLPKYIMATAIADQTAGFASLAAAVDAYEAAADTYSRRVLSAHPSAFLGFRFEAGLPAIKELVWCPSTETLITDGRTVLISEARVKDAFALIPRTPEHETKLRALLDSYITATDILRDLWRAQDPAAYLMAIEMPGSTPAPASGETAAPVAESTAQAELPFNGDAPAASDEDEL